MDDFSTQTLLIWLAGLLVASGFFSIAETSMMAVNRFRLRHLASQGNRGAKLAIALLDRTDKLLGVILLGNNLINAAAATLVTVIAVRLFGNDAEGAANLALLDFAGAPTPLTGLRLPTVAPTEFDVAISYLVRRLEENAASENFMSGIFDLAPGSDAFVREAGRFHSAVEELGKLLATNPPVPGANDHQDRAAQEQAPLPELPAVLPPFDNEPDTNAALPANQAWAREAITMATTAGWLDTVAVPAVIADDEVDDVIATARAAAVDWAARPAAERAAILERADGHALVANTAALKAAKIAPMVTRLHTTGTTVIDWTRRLASMSWTDSRAGSWISSPAA